MGDEQNPWMRAATHTARAQLKVALRALRGLPWVRARLPALDVRPATPLETLSVDPAWIVEGAPVFRAASYMQTPDRRHASGIWECDGPARFRWPVGTDEALCVLEGEAHIEHDGVRYTLRPGDVAFFPAGSVPLWHVPARVRKSFALNEPGRLTRLLRRALDRAGTS